MKILLSWSSGKDSAWALHLLNQQYPGCVAALLTTVNEAYDRVAMHGVRADVLHAQARAARLPLRIVFIPDPCSNESVREAHGQRGDRRVSRRLHPRRLRRSVPARTSAPIAKRAWRAQAWSRSFPSGICRRARWPRK